MTDKELVKLIAATADDKKAQELDVLEIEGLTTLSEYFVIMTGTSNTHLKALAGEIEKLVKEHGGPDPHHIEGYNAASWILMDYGSVLVHIFTGETRKFYSLERLWGDAKKIDYKAL